MSQHLSSEQISRWLVGEHGVQEEQHAGECPACRAELARLESILTQFRNSVLRQSEGQPVAVRFPRARHGLHRPGRWVLATAALLILVTVPLYQNVRERKRAGEQALADTILMEQVDRAVSRAVPRPMEPLVELVRWGSNPAQGSEKKR